MSTDLTDLFESLVLPLEQPSARSLSAVPIPGAESHRLAKDASGAPCLLLREPASARPTAPTRLQNLMVSYCVPCIVTQLGGGKEQGAFTIIKCSSAATSLFPHFLRILSPIVMTLGPRPTGVAVRRAISGLVDLFQALATPAKKSVQGLWAELILIRDASDPRRAVGAWHGTPQEHIDFVSGRERIEVKSSNNRERVHHFSLVQLSPPDAARLLVASLFVERVGGGLSLEHLFEEIRALLASDATLLSRFDAVFYASVGAGWSDAMEECFDVELARESLKFFDAREVPKIEGPICGAVTEVRFSSDLSAAVPLSLNELRNAGGLFASIVPSICP